MENLSQKRAPIYEALERFRRNRVVPFDVPGHKHGRGNPELVELLGERCVSIDVNSMKPLDNLCHPVSVIKEAEALAAEAFGAEHAFLMVGGTTSAVQTMVLACCKKGDKIILPRNVHRSVINAMVLCGARPIYVNPDVDQGLGISLGMKREDVRAAIEENPDAVAVFVNNPTYYGICSDLKAIVDMAHEKGMKVLADEAHGTHFYFGKDLPVSAMEAGAEAEKQAAILRAEAQKERMIKEAEGQAEAVLKVQNANAEGIRMIREAGADQAVLTLKSLEAFMKAADGRATKIIIPSEIQGLAGLASSLKEIVTEEKDGTEH